MERALQIVVTDDDERIRKAAFDILQHAGYEVRVFPWIALPD